MKEPILLIDDNRGIYVPQEFAKNFPELAGANNVHGLLAGPDHPDYWELWEDVKENNVDIVFQGMEGYLAEHYGGVWFIPHGYDFRQD